MRAPFSGSSLGRARKCPASAVLPGVEHVTNAGDIGSALHEHLALRITHGVEYAVEQIGAVATRWRITGTDADVMRARCMHFDWMPPERSIPEAALCLFVDGTVRRIRGGRGAYELPPGGMFPMTVDCMWSEPEPLGWVGSDDDGHPVCPAGSTLWVVDLKTGLDSYVDPVEINDQARAGALLGARWTGAARVVPVILYWRKGPGVWDAPAHWLGEDQLAAVEREIRDAVAAVEEQRLRLRAGDPLRFVEGPQCEFCPAAASCSAKTATLQRYLGDPSAAPLASAPLTLEQKQRLAVFLPQADRFLRRAKDALKADVLAHGPIDLGNGRVWGPEVSETTVIDPQVGVEVLADELDSEQRAREALNITLSRDAIEEAIKESHEQRGIRRQVAPAVRRVMAKIGEAGGLVRKTKTQWHAHKPVAALPAAGADAADPMPEEERAAG